MQSIFSDLSRYILFKSIFKERLAELRASGADTSTIWKAFHDAFPAAVLADEKTMRALQMLSRRIATIQQKRPKYLHVAQMAMEAMQLFLQPAPMDVRERRALLEDWIKKLPANARVEATLRDCGYAPVIFQGPISTYVKLSLLNAAEESLRTSILELYRKYIPLLQERKISTVAGNPLEKLFDSFASMEQLQGERALVARALEGNAQVQALLERESIIWRDFELQQQQQQPSGSGSKTFRIRLNNSFLYALSVCDKNIKGCYEPSCAHAEKPIECGLKLNNRLWSVFDDTDEEIESVESVWTEEGIYFFRAYSNGHSWDTSQCWAALFKRLLLGGLVPRVIVPRGYPTERCFRLLNDHIASIYHRTDLVYADDLFESSSCPSYYDGEVVDAAKPGDLIISADDIAHLPLPEGSLDSIVFEHSGEYA